MHVIVNHGVPKNAPSLLTKSHSLHQIEGQCLPEGQCLLVIISRRNIPPRIFI